MSLDPSHASTTPTTAAPARAGTDVSDFVRDHRIHVEHGALFVDSYLTLHPSELAPEHEGTLRDKLALTYSLDNPSFYESPERLSIALNLGQLVPVSMAATRSELLEQINQFNTQVDSGVDAQLQKTIADKQSPLGGIVRDVLDDPTADPIGMEMLQNGLAMYLLVREKLTQGHYLKSLTAYVERSRTPDQILQDLQAATGLTPIQVREAALKGGIDGVATLLGTDTRYLADVKALVKRAAEKDFSYNLIEHWHIGRQKLGLDAPLDEKIAVGMQERIATKIGQYRAQVNHYYDVPKPIKAEEARIAREDLSVLEPIQRQVMHALGYEICYTPEPTADRIAFHPGIWGLHRRAANDQTDLRSTNRIFYSGHGSRMGSVGTLAHEAAHNLWPNFFSKEEVSAVDGLVGADAKRFTRLQALMDKDFDAFEQFHTEYKAGDAAQKAQAIAQANARFAPYGITVDALFPQLVDAKAFRYLVWDANTVLAVEGARYNRGGYDGANERFREVISRFAEMRQVSHHHEPDVLKFVAPGLTQMWEQYYIPHLERVYQALQQQKNTTGVQGIHAAIASNVSTIVRPDNDNAQPKVQETAFGAPVMASAAQADRRDDVTAPGMVVDKGSLQNFNTLAPALSSLHAMHVV